MIAVDQPGQPIATHITGPLNRKCYHVSIVSNLFREIRPLRASS